ncbi:uncharacterized protein LOC143373813 [Andrena cerasifolii]|uniref:uncharacterized protein LOC143373813 n=1 Tax=Andrena cerasifolii TaxID=2819439 RepID=UPI00403794FC
MKCIGCVVLLNVAILTEATILMTSRDGSECVANVSRRETRYVPYKETYKVQKWVFYKIMTRVNYRIDYVTVWMTESRCCDGYRRQSSHCEPICLRACHGGYCFSPNNCTCWSGHEPSNDPQLKDHVCMPRCDSNCTNGICAMPNVCRCNSGYRLTNNNLYCLPICPVECAPLNAHCAAPDTCTCNPGYAREPDEKNSANCLPQCDVPCQNGKCTAPNLCTCDDGYAPEGPDTSLCKPICEHNCTHGTCAAPNTCSCLPGYRSKNDSFCEPSCSEPCIRGTCTGPDTCVCEDGYGLSESSKYVCQPICENCRNGVCSAPGVCVCNEGFRLNGTEEGKRVCTPFCKIPCEPYGTCDAPNTCTCFDGYGVIDTSGRENEISSNATEEHASACEPICHQSCVHGKCIGPDSCSCDPGYRASTNDSNICQPTCEVDCGGYGACTAPNVCTCNEGCVLDATDRCMPFCNSTCQNSTCVEPNRCQCLDGFVSMNESVCVAFCENDCGNGTCVAPNECRCDAGFVNNQNNSCVRPCTRECKGHGVCVDEHRACECSYGWTGWDCDQPTVCILLMNLDDESLHGVTVHNETNSTLMDARRYAPYCYECNGVVGNKSLCYAMPPVNGASAVGCFVETESPCTLMYRNNTDAVSIMAGALAVVALLIMAIASAAAYFMIRRHRRRNRRSAIVQSALFQGAVANVSLLSEEDSPQ